MQPIIVLPKNISDKVKHAFCILKQNFCYHISPNFVAFPHKHNQKHPKMHQRLYLCDEIACTK